VRKANRAVGCARGGGAGRGGGRQLRAGEVVALEERGVATRPGLNALGVPRELLRAPSMRILPSLCSVLCGLT
jgi:hypothetical protein